MTQSVGAGMPPLIGGSSLPNIEIPPPPPVITPFNLAPPADAEDLADVVGNNAYFNNLFIKNIITGGTPGSAFVPDPFIIGETLRFNATGDPTNFTTDLIAEDFNTLAIRGPEPADVNRLYVYGFYDSGPPVTYERTSFEQDGATAHIQTESNDGSSVELMLTTHVDPADPNGAPITINPGSNNLPNAWAFRSADGAFGPVNLGSLDIRGVRNVGSQSYIAHTGGYQFDPSGVSPLNTLRGGNGVPATSLGNIGDIYFRSDTPTVANQRIYIKTAAAVWTALVV